MTTSLQMRTTFGGNSHSSALTDVVSAFKTVKIMKSKWIASRSANRHVHKLPDNILVLIFSYLSYRQLNACFLVCKKWRQVAKDPKLWTYLCLRPDYAGYKVTNNEILVNLIKTRFDQSLVHIELSDSSIVPPVLHELANSCLRLRYLTLDFSKAVHLKDTNDLSNFPSSLFSITIFLSQVIHLDSFFKKIYQFLNSIRVLQIIGTYEMDDIEVGEGNEVVNLSKLKQHMSSLRVINLFGISFIDDDHVDVLSLNCLHLECLSLNFCLKVTGRSFKDLIKRCPNLNCLLLQQCDLKDDHVTQVAWDCSNIRELDLSYTDLSSASLLHFLSSLHSIHYLAVSHCEYFNDEVLYTLLLGQKFLKLKAIDFSYTLNLSEICVHKFLIFCSQNLEGLILAGKINLNEQFYLDCIPLLKKIKVLVIGYPDSWFLKLQTRIPIDNLIFTIAQNCPLLSKLQIEWDGDCLRYSESSNKFINQLRLKCPRLSSLTLADGEYYELVKSNFERVGKVTVVRTTTSHATSIVTLLKHYKHLTFN